MNIRQPKRKFAVFDIDGTLIRWQLYHTMVDRLARRGYLGENALEELKKARMRWKRRIDDKEFHTYELTLVNYFENALTNISTKEFDILASEVIEEYKDQVYTYTRSLIKKLKTDGYFLIAISGSHEELVAQIASYYQFDTYAGSKYPRKNGTFTGEVIITNHHKKEILEDFTTQHSLTTKESFAVGDSASDQDLLSMVENPIAFNPNKELFEAAKKNKWSIVIERKNVIYQLKEKDGTYQLVQTN